MGEGEGEGGLINSHPVKRGGGLLERGVGLIEDLRYSRRKKLVRS